MGRRSINTTKSGKYMNPTDQARKEARKKELKKNKKQRQIVRTAVLRGKDPMQLLAEMEKIDQMEYNVLQPSPLNEKVLKDKRKKLRDTFDRVMKMYYKDDSEKWEEIRRAEGEYDKRRTHLLTYYEAVRHTQQVSIDEIPLPIPQLQTDSLSMLGSVVPLPNEYGMIPLSMYNTCLPPPPGILRKKSAYSPPPSPDRISKRNKIPPGVPPGPPPELSGEEDEDYRELDRKYDNPSTDSGCDSDRENRKKKKKLSKSKSIRFAESESSDSDNEDLKKRKKSYSSSGQDIDSFMKEMEKVYKSREAKHSAEKSFKNDKESKERIAKIDENSTSVSSSGKITSGLPSAPPLAIPPPLMFRPPPMMMGPGGIRLPPGPPPGRPPTLPPGPPPGLPPRLGTASIRLPPGPPPGIPPSMLRFPNSNSLAQGTPNVVSAAPQLINRGEENVVEEQSNKSSATIEAKAKIRNLNADITRFLPTSVRIKRDEGKPKPKLDKRELSSIDVPRANNKPVNNFAPAIPQPSKDDAYMLFMKEMEELL